MKYFLPLSAFLLFAILFSCTPQQEASSSMSEKESDTQPKLNIDSLVQVIDQQRSKIENSLGEPTTLNTSALREKIKQKWEKIHFYTIDNQVVRIKTYPYANISSRTEEFYLQDGNLIMAAIQDKAVATKGETPEQLDKVYYFHQNESIHEKHKQSEKEYSVRNSDAEELLTEVQEYLEIFSQQNTK